MTNTKEMKAGEFIALTACIMLLTAVAIDIMLPAFDELREYFGLGAESTATAQIVTFFFLGQIGQLAFGPLSDRYGRIAIMRLGFALYIGGCIAAALLPSFSGILAARFVVGMGAAAMSVCAVAGVRDRFVGDKMARTMSMILTIFLFVPIIAPIAGAAILTVAPWQILFLTPAVIAVGVFVWSLRLRESLPPERRMRLDVPNLANAARQVLGNRMFTRYTVVVTVLFSAFSSYVGSSERMISEIYGRPEWFVTIFTAIGITMAGFTFLNVQLVKRFGAQRSIRGLLLAYLIVAILLLALTLAQGGLPNIFLFFTCVALLQGINVAVNPNSDALALEPMGATAGMAAAIGGTSFFVFGSILGSFIDRLLVNSVTPLATGYVLAGAIAVALVFSIRVRATSAPLTSVAESPVGDYGSKRSKQDEGDTRSIHGSG